MIINPSLPSGYVTFCDDIRHEITGKQIFVGVYNGQLLIAGELPAVIPQICANIELKLKQTNEPFSVNIKIWKSDVSEPLYSFEADFDPSEAPSDKVVEGATDPDSLRFIKLGFNAQVQNIVITNPCALKVRAYHGNDEIRLGALQILIAPTGALEEPMAT